MSIRDFVKRNFPEYMIPYLQIPYRINVDLRKKLHRRFDQGAIDSIQARAEKYLLHYQDDLSREILYDRMKFFRTADDNIFMARAIKEGWRFHDIFTIPDDRYSCMSVIYDRRTPELEYTLNLLQSCDWSDRHRIIRLDEFLGGNVKISEDDFVIFRLSDINTMRAKKFMARNNLHNDTKSNRSQIISIREDAQYLDVFEPVDNEIVIDAGCFDGATAMRFLEWGGSKIKHVYSFEFDPENAARCEENLKPFSDKITLVKKGTWDKDDTMYVFEENLGDAGSFAANGGSVKASLTSIDNTVKGEKVTFIKMDVEGAELKSLMGARDTIINHRPRLAISAYHDREDLCKLPEYILSIVPEYKFYLRHYCSNHLETVLYGYCE